MKDPSTRLKRNWKVVGQLLSHEVPKNIFMKAHAFKLMTEWREDYRMKKRMQIEGTFLRNHNMRLNLQIIIMTTAKQYELSVNNDKVRIVSRVPEQNLEKIKDSTLVAK